MVTDKKKVDLLGSHSRFFRDTTLGGCGKTDFSRHPMNRTARLSRNPRGFRVVKDVPASLMEHRGVYRKECQQKNSYPLQKEVAFVS